MPPTGDPHELMAPREVADFFRVTVRTLNRWIDQGVFPGPAVQVGKVRRWWRRDVTAWAVLMSGKRDRRGQVRTSEDIWRAGRRKPLRPREV